MLEQAKDRWLRAVMYDRGLSPAARVLGALLIRDFLGCIRAPDIDAFAKALCASSRATKQALNQLEQAGWLTIPERPKRGNPPCIILTDRRAVLPFQIGNPNHHQGPSA
jgi:hypothetical protein